MIILADLIKAQLIEADQMDKGYTAPPNPNKDFTWQKKMENKYKNKPRTPGKVLPEGTFTKSPGEIAQILKNHAPDYKSAQSHLNSYINRSGRNLQGADKERLHQSKEALKNAYGVQDKKETKAIAEQPIYALPPGHNKDDQAVNLLKVEPDNREKFTEQDPQMKTNLPKLNAARRLKASILNSVQDPNQRMSSVEKANSTSMDNLDETNIAPEESTADATFDSLDNNFEEVNPVSNRAYATASSILGRAVQRLVTAEKWSGEVKTKKHPPEGLFAEGSGEAIAKWLKSSHSDLKGAMGSLNFYVNRGGSNLSPERKKVLEGVKSKIQKMYGE